jgi:hypothetical protein
VSDAEETPNFSCALSQQTDVERRWLLRMRAETLGVVGVVTKEMASALGPFKDAGGEGRDNTN